MKTNPLTSLLNKAKKGFCSLLNLYRKHPSFIRIVITVLVLFSFFVILSIYLPSCKSPATLTSDTQHRAQDSTYRATVHRIETHDTIIFGAPYIQSMVRPGDRTSLKAGGDACVPGHIAPQYPSPILRISDRKITIRDTVFIARTDTLLRTQTITKPQKYIPPFYRFCTISFVSFVSFVTLAFSIHLLLRYLKIRSPT